MKRKRKKLRTVTLKPIETRPAGILMDLILVATGHMSPDDVKKHTRTSPPTPTKSGKPG